MFVFVYTENAQADIINHAIFYEKKLEGLGIRFMEEVDRAAEEVSVLPTGYASYYKATRERGMKNFPYKLIYTIEKEIVYIHAVYPSLADPKKKYKGVKRSK
jgi:hypothetical protein